MGQQSLLSELIRPGYFESLKSYFEKRARTNTQLLSSAPVDSSTSLSWCLRNWPLISREIRRELKRKRYTPKVRVKNQIMLDRLRTIYSQYWIDKIVEHGLASLIYTAMEKSVSDSLHSHRQGHSTQKTLLSIGEKIASRASHSPLFIIQHDIKQYAETIPAEPIIDLVEQLLGPQDPYLRKVLRAFLRPQYREIGEKEVMELSEGLPTGSHLTNLAGNLYLTDIDFQLESSCLHYSRYGDDLFLLFEDLDTALKTDSYVQKAITAKSLQLNKEKSVYTSFSPSPPQPFRTKQFCEYLGVRINQNGVLSLPPLKHRKLKKFITLHLKNQRLLLSQNYNLNPEECVEYLCHSATALLHAYDITPYLDILLHTANDETFLRSFDQWLAELILQLSYECSRTSVFKHQSYASLRELGLPSVRHLRTLQGRG